MRLRESLEVTAILNRLALFVAFVESGLRGQGALGGCLDCSLCRAGPGKGPVHTAISVYRSATATLLGLFAHCAGQYAGSQSSELFRVLMQSEFQVRKNGPQDGLYFRFASCGNLAQFADAVL